MSAGSNPVVWLDLELADDETPLGRIELVLRQDLQPNRCVRFRDHFRDPKQLRGSVLDHANSAAKWLGLTLQPPANTRARLDSIQPPPGTEPIPHARRGFLTVTSGEARILLDAAPELDSDPADLMKPPASAEWTVIGVVVQGSEVLDAVQKLVAEQRQVRIAGAGDYSRSSSISNSAPTGERPEARAEAETSQETTPPRSKHSWRSRSRSGRFNSGSSSSSSRRRRGSHRSPSASPPSDSSSDSDRHRSRSRDRRSRSRSRSSRRRSSRDRRRHRRSRGYSRSRTRSPQRKRRRGSSRASSRSRSQSRDYRHRRQSNRSRSRSRSLSPRRPSSPSTSSSPSNSPPEGGFQLLRRSTSSAALVASGGSHSDAAAARGSSDSPTSNQLVPVSAAIDRLHLRSPRSAHPRQQSQQPSRQQQLPQQQTRLSVLARSNSVLQALLPLARSLPASTAAGSAGGSSPQSPQQHRPNQKPQKPHLLTQVDHHGLQGLRPTMEDECDMQRWTVPDGANPHIQGEVCFLAVYDGHGGRGAAIHARDTVSGLVRAGLASGKSAEAALRAAYLGADRSALLDGSGTTAVSVLVELATGRLWCANAGDSRAVVCSAAAVSPGRLGDMAPRALSEDHKPGDDSERRRIMAAGGRVARTPGGIWRVIYWKDDVYLSLACARAIGDNHYNQLGDVITAEPDIREDRIGLGGEDYLLLACDGLWDVATPRGVHALLAELWERQPEVSAKQIARYLCEQAIQMGSHDNVSVVFAWTPPQDRKPPPQPPVDQ